MTRMIETPERHAPIAFLNADRPLSILLIGAGGNGSECFEGLVRLHSALQALGGQGLNVTVMDDDDIEPSNVVRQRFYPHEVGTNKAVAIVQRSNLLLGTNWQAIPFRFTTAHPDNHDLVITAVDNLDARRAAISRFENSRNQTFWLDMGCQGDSGQVFLGQFGHNTLTEEWPTVLAHYPEIATREDDNRPSCSAADSLARQDLMINSAVAGAAVNLLWKLMRKGKLASNGVMVDLDTGNTQSVPFMPTNNQVKH